MFKRVAATFSLLTIIPIGRKTTEEVTPALWAFPLAGLVIGAIAGGVGAALLAAGIEPLLAGVCTVAALLFLTGLHHIDGLSDLADALMARGTRERRLKVLKDPATGVAGTSTVAVYIMALVGALYTLGPVDLFIIVIVAEVSAKVAMVVVMYTGRAEEGSSAAPLVRAAKSTRVLIATIAIGVVIAHLAVLWALPEWFAPMAVLVGSALALYVAHISRSSFGSLRGDTIGACNEVARLAAVIFMVVL